MGQQKRHDPQDEAKGKKRKGEKPPASQMAPRSGLDKAFRTAQNKQRRIEKNARIKQEKMSKRMRNGFEYRGMARTRRRETQRVVEGE